VNVSIIDHGNRNARSFDSRSEAESKANDLAAMDGVDSDEIEVVQGDFDSYAAYKGTADGGEVNYVEHTADESSAEDEPVPDDTSTDEPAQTPAQEPQGFGDALAELGEELETDPLSILPSHMVDTISGEPAVNKRGYAMIAERYGIETSAEIVSFPWENDENRCVAKATAITEDGKEYTGWATACAEDGDMEDQIIELAETRSLKRSVSWASGVGIVSYQELTNQLEE